MSSIPIFLVNNFFYVKKLKDSGQKCVESFITKPKGICLWGIICAKYIPNIDMNIHI